MQNFATLLTSCKNTLKSIGYSSKIENQDSLRGVIDRLPYDLRKKWRNTADQISEDQDIEIKFEDIVVFVEKQARAASHPVFGDISARSWCHEREKTPTPNQKEKALQSKGRIQTREEAMKTRKIPLVKGMEIQRTVQSVQGIIICMTVSNLKGSLLRSVHSL